MNGYKVAKFNTVRVRMTLEGSGYIMRSATPDAIGLLLLTAILSCKRECSISLSQLSSTLVAMAYM